MSLSVCNENIPCLLVAMAAHLAWMETCDARVTEGGVEVRQSPSAGTRPRQRALFVSVRPRIQQDTAALFPDFTSRWQQQANTLQCSHPVVTAPSLMYCLFICSANSQCIWSVTVLIVLKLKSILSFLFDTSLRLIQTSTRKAFVNYIRNMPGSSRYALHIISHDNPHSSAGRYGQLLWQQASMYSSSVVAWRYRGSLVARSCETDRTYSWRGTQQRVPTRNSVFSRFMAGYLGLG